MHSRKVILPALGAMAEEEAEERLGEWLASSSQNPGRSDHGG